MENVITVLVVDDEPAGREALEGVLFSQGYNLIFAGDGEEALRMAQEYMPDLILLDVMMPKMDGFEVCRRMRADPILAEIPILLITALDDRASRIKGIDSGADDFISKPFDRIELRARVRTVTRLNRYRRLLLERARFVWVIDKAKEGYLILDSNGRVTYANPAAGALLSLPASESGEIVFREWVKKQYHCEPDALWDEWTGAEPAPGPLFLIRPGSESERPVWFQLEMLGLPYGDSSRLLLRIVEITERISLYQEVWNFHKTITRKLHAPVSEMVLAAELFKHRVSGGAGQEDASELADMVLEGAKRLQGDIEAILRYLNMPALARSNTGFDLARLKGLAFRLSGEMGLKKPFWYADPGLPEQLPIKLSCRSLEVILWEILENARKFHPRGDPQVEFHLAPHGTDAVRFSIKDNGVQLMPEQLRQVWIPYYQAVDEFAAEGGGMGLGLSTVATLVWEVGGTCRMINRDDGPGVVVELVIPAGVS